MRKAILTLTLTTALSFVGLSLSARSAAASFELSTSHAYKRVFTTSVQPTDEDSISSRYALEEVVVLAPARHTDAGRDVPSGCSFLLTERLQAIGYKSPTDLSAVVPNVYIPDYGSRRTTPIYIRGLGSRNGSPSASVYVNGVPILYGANINFRLPSLRAVEVLRGPQGTLYGRNSLGGIINLYTYSPFDKRQTRVSASGGNYGLLQMDGAMPVYASDQFALSASFSAERSGGYWTNMHTGKKADALIDFMLGIEAAWRISPKDLLSLSLSGGHLSQGAFPYMEYNYETKERKPLSLNAPSSYKRSNMMASLSYHHRGELSSCTLSGSFEWLHDEMKMDQDYSERDIFNIGGGSKAIGGAIEALCKWHDSSERHNLSVGASLYTDNSTIDNPIRLGADGVNILLRPVLDKVSSNPKLPFRIEPGSPQGENISTLFRKPQAGAALYGQYTINDLLIRGLSLTAGLHVGVDRYALNYDVNSAFSFLLTPKAGNGVSRKLAPPVALSGEMHRTNFLLSPRVALGYEISSQLSAYLSYSHGYRSGNFNEQQFADIIMMAEMKALQAAMQGKELEPDPTLEQHLVYKPEHGRNFEFGMRGNHFNERLQWDVALFATLVKDLQLTDFVASGLGRKQSNHGRGRYLGLETSLFYRPISPLTLSLSYGFTQATILGVMLANDQIAKEVPVPYVPSHTLALSAEYARKLDARRFFIDAWALGASCSAIGPIYYTFDKKEREELNSMVDIQASVSKGDFSLWIRGYNLTSSQRTAFYFRSLGRTLVQPVAPLRFEVGITWMP